MPSICHAYIYIIVVMHDDQVVIENKQHYKVLGKAVDLTTLIRLQVENGKVVKHEDWYVSYYSFVYKYIITARNEYAAIL